MYNISDIKAYHGHDKSPQFPTPDSQANIKKGIKMEPMYKIKGREIYSDIGSKMGDIIQELPDGYLTVYDRNSFTGTTLYYPKRLFQKQEEFDGTN
jgi:hypothetical protein